MSRSPAQVLVRANHALSRTKVLPTPLSPVMMFNLGPNSNFNSGARPMFSRVNVSNMIKVMIKPGWDANKRALIRGSWRQAEKAILAKSNPRKRSD